MRPNLFLWVCSSFLIAFILSCGDGPTASQPPSSDPPPSSNPGSGGNNSNPAAGVFMWKGNSNGAGTYDTETRLTPEKVNVNTFGKLASFQTDGVIMAQPLYFKDLDMGSTGVHDVIIVATENDTVYAFDESSTSGDPLWKRSLLGAGEHPGVDNFGGRTALGGTVGITGTPVIDPSTKRLYVVATVQKTDGTAQQWLHCISLVDGSDAGAGAVQIQASVPGDGRASVNGQIAFDPVTQNQRAGLLLHNGVVFVAWGSFSDYPPYHGWLMAYDATSLQQLGVFNTTTQYIAIDPGADHGGGGAIWQGGAAVSVDSDGYLYVVGADGSFNADSGGNDYGDTVMKLQFVNGKFQVVDWFTPHNQECINRTDIEIGSGGVAMLPITNGQKLAAVISKEGRFFLLNRDNLGHYNSAGNSQIPQSFMVGAFECSDGITSDQTEGTTWNRLYGNVSYWNGNVYMAMSNGHARQYAFSNGLLNSAPVAESTNNFGSRGGSSVVSANGTSNAIVWIYEKSGNGGPGILHAYDATNISHELWNSDQNQTRDGMSTGISFGTPVVADGKVLAAYSRTVAVYGLLQ